MSLQVIKIKAGVMKTANGKNDAYQKEKILKS